MNPLIGAGLISGGLGLVSDLFGAGAQLSMNEEYLEYLRETNRLNYKMFQENQAFQSQEATTAYNRQMNLQNDQQNYNAYMWERNNAYNDPSAQRERWEKAGFSPYSMTGGASASMSSSAPTSGVGSAPQAGSVGTPSMAVPQQMPNPTLVGLQGLKTLASSASDIIGAINDSKRTSNDTQRVGLELKLGNQTYDQLNDLHPWNVMRSKADSQFLENTRRAREQSVDLANRVTLAQEAQLLLNNEALRIQNKYLDQKESMQLSLFAAQTFQAYADGNLSLARVKEAIAHSVLMREQRRGLKITNDQAEKLSESYVESMMLLYGNQISVENAIKGGFKSLGDRKIKDYGEKAAAKRILPSYNQKTKGGLGIRSGSAFDRLFGLSGNFELEQNW